MKKDKKILRKNVFKTMILCCVMTLGFLTLAGCSKGKTASVGAKWYKGTENIETVTFGVVGDFYFDADDYILYQKKDNGVWEILIENFGKPGENGEQGPSGTEGASFLNGISDPTKDIGKNGDTYLNYISLDLFVKRNGVWLWVDNIKGETGNTENRIRITKTGGSDNPVYLTEDKIQDVSLNYAENQDVTVYNANRLDINSADFYAGSYSTYTTVIKENNGLTLNVKDRGGVDNARVVRYDYTAEFDGKLWLSCEASCTGDVSDIGMRMSVNGAAQQLCRGQGKLQECADVTAGDTIRLTFYAHIGTSADNIIYYKNIMLNYGENPIDYCDYISDLKTKIVLNKKTIDLTNLTYDDLTTSGTKAGAEGYYGFKFDVAAILPASLLPADNKSLANIIVSGLPLITYNEAYQNNVGIGISSTGIAFAYLGEGFTRTTAAEWFKNNPVEITYQAESGEITYAKIDESLIKEGAIIVSDSKFDVTYTYSEKEKTKSIVCFGDSITGMATNGTDYVSIIERNSNFNAYNVGFSGASWTDYPNGGRYLPFSLCRLVDSVCCNDFSSQEQSVAGGNMPETYAERLATLKKIDFSKIDYITIFYGTNDWGNGATLKSENDTATANKQYSNIEDAINYTIRKLNENFPQAKIIVLTPYYRCLNKQDCATTPNKSGDYLYDYSKFMETTALNNDVLRVINMFDMLPIDFGNYKAYIPDGTHPNDSLKNIIADIIIKNIKRFG